MPSRPASQLVLELVSPKSPLWLEEGPAAPPPHSTPPRVPPAAHSLRPSHAGPPSPGLSRPHQPRRGSHVTKAAEGAAALGVWDRGLEVARQPQWRGPPRPSERTEKAAGISAPGEGPFPVKTLRVLLSPETGSRLGTRADLCSVAARLWATVTAL